MNNELAQLSIDLYNNKNMMFNEVSGDLAMRRIINEAIGQDKDAKKIDFYAWEDNKNKVFSILAVAIDAVLPRVLTNELDGLAEIKTTAHGDQAVFEMEDSSLFRVGLVASGTQDLRAQELVGENFTIDTDWYGAKVYAELEKFLAGNVNWQTYINRVATSFANHLSTKILDAFTAGYDALRAAYKSSGTYSEDKLRDLADMVQAKSGSKKVSVYGTASALRKVSKDADLSDSMKDQMNRVGYLGEVGGISLIQLPQAFRAGKEEFALDNKTLIILPENEKVVSIAIEGQALVSDKDPMGNTMLRKEFLTMKKLGVQVAQTAIYGMYKMS